MNVAKLVQTIEREIAARQALLKGLRLYTETPSTAAKIIKSLKRRSRKVKAQPQAEIKRSKWTAAQRAAIGRRTRAAWKRRKAEKLKAAA